MQVLEFILNESAGERIEVDNWAFEHVKIPLHYSPDMRMLIGMPLASVGKASTDGL